MRTKREQYKTPGRCIECRYCCQHRSSDGNCTHHRQI